MGRKKLAKTSNPPDSKKKNLTGLDIFGGTDSKME